MKICYADNKAIWLTLYIVDGKQQQKKFKETHVSKHGNMKHVLHLERI